MTELLAKHKKQVLDAWVSDHIYTVTEYNKKYGAIRLKLLIQSAFNYRKSVLTSKMSHEELQMWKDIYKKVTLFKVQEAMSFISNLRLFNAKNSITLETNPRDRRILANRMLNKVRTPANPYRPLFIQS